MGDKRFHPSVRGGKVNMHKCLPSS
jgi:hypothetical protein